MTGGSLNFGKTLDRSALTGFITGFALVIFAIASQGKLSTFLDFPSFLIVGGGVVATALINFGFESMGVAFSIVKEVLTETKHDLRTDIELMNMFARKVRREGLLMLEDDVQHINNHFLQNGFQLAIDGISKKSLENILEDQIKSQERRLDNSFTIMDSMANYSPAFGMIGTVIGLILMLQNISDPNSLSTGLAIALITTFYGAILANLIFTPLAGKISHIGEHEMSRYEMFKVAIMSIVNEENPRIMEKKMLSYVSPEDRAEYIKYYDSKGYSKKREEVLYANWTQQQNTKWQNLLKVLETG